MPIIIDLTQVESFRPNNSINCDDFSKEILVTLKSGDSVVIRESYFKFKKLFIKKYLFMKLYESIIN